MTHPRPGRTETTVGVALPIPEPWGSQLQDARCRLGEGRARTIPTHITLLPPTAVAQPTVERMRDHLAAVARRHRPFRVVLRGTGTFRPVSRVVYIQVAQGVAPCEQLEQSVRQGPVRPQRSFPYHPHVTVAQDLPEPALDRAFTDLADFTAEFTAEEFHLYVRHGDEVWRTAQSFALGEPAQAT